MIETRERPDIHYVLMDAIGKKIFSDDFTLTQSPMKKELDLSALDVAVSGSTPAAYIEAQRVETARRLLETSGRTVAEVADACGFGRVETMHRAFRRRLRVAPAQYRRHFRAAP